MFFNQLKADNKSSNSELIIQDAQLILKAVKAHWGIENNVHWVLDVMMNEDKTCIKNNYSAENRNVIKKISINILYSIQKKQLLNLYKDDLEKSLWQLT